MQNIIVVIYAICNITCLTLKIFHDFLMDFCSMILHLNPILFVFVCVFISFKKINLCYKK